MTFGLRIAFLLLLATGTVTVKGLTTTVPSRGDGFQSSPGTAPDQGSSTTVSTTGGVSATDSTTGGSSTTASTTTEGVTTTDCPPGDRLRRILQALFGRWSSNGPTGGPGEDRLRQIVQALFARRSNDGRRPIEGGFRRPSSSRYPRGLKIYDLIRGGNGGNSGPRPAKPTRPSPTEPTGQSNGLFNLADALPTERGATGGPGGDFQQNVLFKLDTIHEELKQLFRLLPRIMAERLSK